MCPCPVCAAIAVLLIPFACFKWAKKWRQKHHDTCSKCQTETPKKCGCSGCRCQKRKAK